MWWFLYAFCFCFFFFPLVIVHVFNLILLYCINHFKIKLFSLSDHSLISDAKRLIGRRFEDSVVQADMKHWPFKVISDGGRPKVEVEYKGEAKNFYPEEISSMVLVKMKEIAEAYLGKVSEGC